MSCWDKNPRLAIAGPGSGKTHMITETVKDLIKNGIDPRRILVITFTKKAADELLHRISCDNKEHSGVVIGTYHSIALKLLKLLLPNFNHEVIDQRQATFLIKQILKEKNIKVDAKNFLMDLTKIRSCNINSHEAWKHATSEQERMLCSAYYYYEQTLQKKRMLDFDGILSFFLRYEDQMNLDDLFDFILIDEAQDNSKVQFSVSQSFLRKHQNIFMIGDFDQSIYSFRGACLEELLNFEQKYSKVERIVLEKNYRSAPNIVALANKLILNNKQRIHKDCVPFKTENGTIEYECFASSDEEIFWLISKLKELSGSTAILFRSNWQLIQTREKIEVMLNGLQKQEGRQKKEIVLTTIHSSKGLEFDNVLIMGMEAFSFPHKEADEEEERRLFYVAITRAKQNLYITHCLRRDKVLEPSIFLKEIC